MTRWILERLFWAIAVCAGATTVVLVFLSSRSSLPTEAALPSMEGVMMYDVAQLRVTAEHVATMEPAGFDGEQGTQTADAAPMPAPSEPIQAQLQLHLSGVSGGPPWRAIMSGVPGRDGGVVVNPGDTVGGIKVRSIRRDTVIVQTKDSTMTFVLRR